MVRWNISNTSLWKNKDVEKESFELLTEHEPTNICLLAAIGIWAIWQQAQKVKKAKEKGKKEELGMVVLTKNLVDECFGDKENGANSFVVGGLDQDQEKTLHRAMDLLVGAEFW